jgi:hypothetical protein
VQLLKEREQGTQLAHQGRILVRARYDWEAIGRQAADAISAGLRATGAPMASP